MLLDSITDRKRNGVCLANFGQAAGTPTVREIMSWKRDVRPCGIKCELYDEIKDCLKCTAPVKYCPLENTKERPVDQRQINRRDRDVKIRARFSQDMKDGLSKEDAIKDIALSFGMSVKYIKKNSVRFMTTETLLCLSD